ncbi:oligosaccharide flippase family protein [Micromonospora sp. NPDC049891]|uniref:lipopolysaccharide biosynthesis protein n=1 Tax=Micromonospora sp. NPDC049891 TaxID=3155655 RepID=UPI0033F438D2
MEEKVVGTFSRRKSLASLADRPAGAPQLEVVRVGRMGQRRPSAATGFAWSIAGLVTVQLSQWAVIVFLSRLGSPEMVGHYALGLAISAPVILVAGLALRTVQVTDVGPLYVFNDYLRLRIVGMVTALGVIGAVVPFLGAGKEVVVLLVSVAKALDGVGDTYWGLFQRHERMRPIGVSMITNGLVTVVAVIALLLMTASVEWAAVGSLIGSLAGSIGYCVWAARPLGATSSSTVTLTGSWAVRPLAASALHRMARLAVVAAPLGLSSGLVSLSANLPRYLLGHELGSAALGIFAALAYVVLAANVLFAAISQLLLPKLTRLVAAGNLVAFTRLTLGFLLSTLCWGAVALVAVAFVGPATIRLIYGPPYEKHGALLILLAAVSVLSGMVYFLNAALCVLRKFGNQLAASVLLVTVAGIGAHLLIPRYGLIGAAWSMMIAVGADVLLKSLMLKVALANEN